MSVLGDVATAVVGLLSTMQSAGADVFATVEIGQAGERKAAATALGRRRTPAATVLYDGRAARGRGEPVPGEAVLSVLIALQNLRGEDAALSGAAGRIGAFEVLELVSAALDGAVVQGDHRLTLQDERQVAGDHRSVVFEQRFRVERLSETAAPTFGGSAIAGTGSVVAVHVGHITAETIDFGFPGIDGVYRHQTGTRGRTISWRGRLVAVDDAALNQIEAELDRLSTEQLPATMVDAWGRSYAECVLDGFEREGARRRHPTSGAALQAFELTFTQLRV